MKLGVVCPDSYDLVMPWVEKRRRKMPVRLTWQQVRRWGLVCVVLFLMGCHWLLPNLPYPTFLERWNGVDGEWETWRPIQPGVEYCRGRFELPRRIKAHALRVDLTHPWISLAVVRRPGRQPMDARTEYVGTFLREHGFKLAFNATHFLPKGGFSGRSVDVQGLGITDGVMWSAPDPQQDACYISAGGRIEIASQAALIDDTWQGFGGVKTLLRKGQRLGDGTSIDAATVSGLSQDGRYFYCLVVDGNQFGYSEGATTEELARFMEELGAADALLLDSGPTVTLAVDDSFWRRRILNRPYHRYLNGLQNPVGVVVGIRVDPQ